MMPKITKKAREVADAIEQVQRMGSRRARFVLTALLAADRISVKAFRRACLMADYPVPIEQERYKELTFDQDPVP